MVKKEKLLENDFVQKYHSIHEKKTNVLAEAGTIMWKTTQKELRNLKF